MSTRPVRALWASAGAATALLLAACGSAEPAEPTTDATTEAAATTDATQAPADDVVAAAQAVVDAATKGGEFTAPGPELGDLSALEGKTVHYVAANYQIPMFHNVADAITEALETVGVGVQVCDGKASPASMATCLDQAVNAGADAVISGSIPEELATVGFKAVQDAGIPLLFTQVAPAGPGAPDKVAYLTPNNIELNAWNSNWVIADSGGAADILIVKVTDTPATTMWTDEGAIKVYEQACPDCTVTVVETNTGQLQKLPSLVTAALVADPEIGYVHAPFDITVQPTVQGIQAAGRTDVKVASSDGNLAVMQMLGEGRFMATEVGYNQNAFGWYAADQTLRMMSGNESVQNLTFPFRRLFDASNVGELELTPEAETAGSWYGGLDYKDGFKQLWGVS